MTDKTLKEKAISIKGKDYVQVKDRIIFFNENYPNGMITTELVSDEERVIMKAMVIPDASKPERYFTGISASNPAKNIESQVPHEVAETSAVGRALAMMGIGVIDSVASVDEMRKVVVTPENDVMERAVSNGLKCKKCGGELVKNPKTGSYFCKAKCWLKESNEIR